MKKFETNFSSIKDALEHFKLAGFDIEFNIKNNKLQHPLTKNLYPLDEVQVVHSIKIEDDSDSDQTTYLHLIESSEGIKGTVQDAAGMYSELDFLSKIRKKNITY